MDDDIPEHEIPEVDPLGRAMARFIEVAAAPSWSRESRSDFIRAVERLRCFLPETVVTTLLWSQLTGCSLGRGPTLAERRSMGGPPLPSPDNEDFWGRCLDWLEIPDPADRDRIAAEIGLELARARRQRDDEF